MHQSTKKPKGLGKGLPRSMTSMSLDTRCHFDLGKLEPLHVGFGGKVDRLIKIILIEYKITLAAKDE